MVVLSGLAAGIDGAAHEAAMHAGGRTIAVIGTSLDQAYPREHASLQARIAREHLVVSPFAAGTPSAPWHFPKRNRLMALLAQATILIEASASSGTRHQVAACASLGRPVFAPADLVDRLDWLHAPSVRDHVHAWREPGDVARFFADHRALS
jgi:DNA processing protein